jgi:hypothetical protein
MSPQAHFNRYRTLVPALVAAVLLTLAASAQARPADPSTAAATPTRAPAGPPTWPARPRQINAVPVETTETLPGPPTWPAHPQPIKAIPAVDDSSGVNWTTIGLGLAGSLLAVSGIVALTGRHRRLSVTPQ